jgi:hypothetical protein
VGTVTNPIDLLIHPMEVILATTEADTAAWAFPDRGAMRFTFAGNADILAHGA